MTNTAVRAWAPAVAWALFILICTTVPIPPDLVETPDWPADKLVHFGLYGVWGVTLAHGIQRTGRSGRGYLFVWVGGVLFAAADELHQHWIATRVPDFYDWVADVVGLTAGILVYGVVSWRIRKGPEKGPEGVRESGSALPSEMTNPPRGRTN